MKIYKLEIEYTNDQVLTEKSVSYTDELGYYSELSIIKNVIINQMKTYEDDNNVLSIFCHTINLDTLWDIGYNKFTYFDKNGDITSVFEYDRPFTPDKTYKIGDIISLKNSSKHEPMYIGIVAGLPTTVEETYYILLYSNQLEDGELVQIPDLSNPQKYPVQEYMDHTHEVFQDMYKSEPSKEISSYLKKSLKKYIPDDEYQKLFREEKLENILKDKEIE